MTTGTACPFCDPEPRRVFLRLRHVFALWDGFPVAEGHALIVPYRHVATWFDASDAERSELVAAIDTVCGAIRERGTADGFNFGVNVGAAAGQTVPHLHLHVIPRRLGDMPDPRGGVRHVIPGKGNYLVRGEPSPPQAADVKVGLNPAEGGAARFDPGPSTPDSLPFPVAVADTIPMPVAVPARATAPTPATDPNTAEASADGPLLTTGESDPLLPRLEQDLAQATRVDIAVAFVMPSGMDRLYPHFDDLLERGGTLRLLTGDYLGITDPDALRRLLDLGTLHGADRLRARVFITNGRSFHPKAYLLTRDDTHAVAYVGSSNLSSSALTDGIEWNYRVHSRRDAAGLTRIRAAFDALFGHPQTRPLDAPWIDDYRERRPAIRIGASISSSAIGEVDAIDAGPEPEPKPPEPNVVQREALAALELTRAAGNKAGLVVMATGLGKTWLAAFDVARAQFRRVLLVAHREEILKQALATFRRIRPHATLGLYTGTERAPDADILFASVQTLSRREHLDRFDRSAFDYVVVDEFHHAAAATYRRLIEHFDPAFLLGLTATPERSDGGDLLALCGENLVYRCAVPRGIELDLLCPYRYFGVPDDVDYRNIPWRSTRFDETALTDAVSTNRRAQNVVEQWRMRGGARTIAFCASQRHADFMKRYFADRGVPCAVVHAGPTSDPRALSLEHLADGTLQVVFAVDMFNEGVDVPAIDTVMMLRPTESPIVWLQQFGRGLRKYGDKRLNVVDYIGNHRSFLVKVRALLAIEPSGDWAVMAALKAAQAGALELPPGCEVTYELQALDILRALLRVNGNGTDALREYYLDFRERRGQRPTASEAFHDGYLPRTARVGYGSWLGLVAAMGDLDDAERAALEAGRVFLTGLETTKMTRSYKMLVLQSMLNTDTLPDPGIAIDELATEFGRLARRSERLRDDVGMALDDPGALRALIVGNPVAAWSGAGAIPGDTSFVYLDGRFRYTRTIAAASRDAFQRLVRELVEWRLAEYLSRSGQLAPASGFTMKVSHTNGRPILFLPDRGNTPGIPEGWQPVSIDGVPHQANFVKIAVNVIRAEGSEDNEDNLLPQILRQWFGPDAGLPGTDFSVVCEAVDGRWTLRPFIEKVSA